LLAVALTGIQIGDGVVAKSPGGVHCYRGVCHRVLTLREAERRIGVLGSVVATHYDDPRVDRFNTGKFTSSGEAFDAENGARAASANLPDGAEVLVWHPGTLRAAHLRINDFGPFKNERTLDVTRAVAEDLGFAGDGVATLTLAVIWVPDGDVARYRRARSYPPSLGLIGVVAEAQLPALVAQLVATAARRNNGDPSDDIEVALAPPSFRSEAVATDEEAERRLAVFLAVNSVIRLPVIAPDVVSGRIELPVLALALDAPEIAAPPLATDTIAADEPAPDTVGPTSTVDVAIAPSAPTIAVLHVSEPRGTVQLWQRFIERTPLRATSVATGGAQVIALWWLLAIGLCGVAIYRRVLSRRSAGRHLRRDKATSGRLEASVRMPDDHHHLGVDLDIAGEVAATKPIQIAGRVCGGVQAPEITISLSGRVEGAVAADDVIVHGYVVGAIYARRLTVGATGVVIGEVTADAIEIAHGATLEADVRRLPDAAAAVAQTDLEAIARTIARAA
jgi:rare lipoprotein A